MRKRRKKASQLITNYNLSDQDFHLACNFLVKLASKFQMLIDDMKLSRKPSKVFLKSTKSKGLTGMFLLFRTEFTQANDRSPTDINRILDENLRPKSSIAWDNVLKEEFIPPKRLSEVLKVLEDAGLFLHIKNKKDIKKIIGYKRSKLNGRPSVYIVSKNIVGINEFLSRPEIRKFIMKYLIESKLLHKFFGLLIRGFYQFVMEANEKQLYNGFRSVTHKNSDEITKIVHIYSKVKSMLLSSDKRLLDKMIGESTNEVMEIIMRDEQTFLNRILVILLQLRLD